MATTGSIHDLKAGDQVFVVRQRGRYSKEEQSGIETVSRVGRKYAYIKRRFEEVAFCRKTGMSVHDRDCNARANGLGFDVYLCEEDYRNKQFNDQERARLEKRILGPFGRLVALSPDVVNKINSILDSEGLD